MGLSETQPSSAVYVAVACARWHCQCVRDGKPTALYQSTGPVASDRRGELLIGMHTGGWHHAGRVSVAQVYDQQ